jgi:osmotically-inducible protein OsmY
MIQIVPPISTSFEHGVLAEARRRLQGSSYLSLRRLSCEYMHGLLTIRGEVPSYYLKQLAQSLVSTLAGVAEVNNQVRVALLEYRAHRSG